MNESVVEKLAERREQKDWRRRALSVEVAFIPCHLLDLCRFPT